MWILHTGSNLQKSRLGLFMVVTASPWFCSLEGCKDLFRVPGICSKLDCRKGKVPWIKPSKFCVQYFAQKILNEQIKIHVLVLVEVND